MNKKQKDDQAIARYIDAYIDLYGYISSKVLVDTFGIHRVTASKQISAYRDANPGNLRFKTEEQRHEKTFTFKKRALLSSSLDYLNAIDLVFPPTSTSTTGKKQLKGNDNAKD